MGLLAAPDNEGLEPTPDQSGLGIELDEKLMAKYRLE